MALPLAGEDDVQQYLEEVRAKYPGANHHAFAFRVGLGVPVERFSDDGEPSGTAGMPLLSLLQGRDLVNSLLIVSRIFGGTLLGKGGLVRAYSEAGREAMKAARPAEYAYGYLLSLQVPYDSWGELEYGLRNRGYSITGVNYGESVDVDLWISRCEREGFEAWLAEISSGSIVPLDRGTRYVARKVIGE